MNDKARTTESWILLDSQSTVDIFMNKLKNIMQKRLFCYIVMQYVNKVGDFPGYGTKWFYEDGFANILSFNNVKKKYCMTYDSSACDCFEVHKVDFTKCLFMPKMGLFYLSVNMM